MVQIDDRWRAWIEAELAWLLGAELFREDTTARMPVWCIDDTET